MKSWLLAILSISLSITTLHAQEPQTEWIFRGTDLAFPQGKNADWLPDKLLRLYKTIEDDDAQDEKALRVYVDQRVLQDQAIPILRTPTLDVPVGVYRVTARVKMTGMLNVIGNAVYFHSRSNSQLIAQKGNRKLQRYYEPTIHGYHFQEEDLYQEISYLYEVIEPDYITQRPARPSHRTSFGRIASKTALDSWRQGQGYPWDIAAAERAELAARKRAENPLTPEQLRQGKLPVYMDYIQTEPLGFARIQPTIRHLTIDWLKIQKLPEPEHIVVRKIVPSKLWMRPGDSCNFQVWTHNRSGTARQGTLRVSLQHGTNQTITVGEQPIQLDDTGYAVTTFPWQAPNTDLWGCMAIAELIIDGKSVSQAEDVFQVHQNPWAVQNHGGANRLANPYYSLPNYKNYVEVFGVTPGDALKPYPDTPNEPYISGMSDFNTSMDTQKMYVEYNQTIGVSNFLYIQPAVGTGVFPELLYQKHPDWFSSPIAWTDQIHDTWVNAQRDMRQRWHAGQRLEPYNGLLHIEARVNYAIPWMFENLLDGTLKNLLHVGWDGVRWDADFPVRSTTNKGVSYGPGSPQADRQLSASYSTRFKKTIREQVPHYTEGANIGTPEHVWNRKFADATDLPPTDYHDAFLSDGASAMSEDWMNAWIYTDARNNIRDYYWGARRCVEWCRQRGGFWHAFPPNREVSPYFTQSMIYFNNLIPLAGGSYPGQYSCSPGSETGMAHFVTRFSEFLYDLNLQPLEDAEDLITVDADQEIWYADGARWRNLPDGKRRYVITLINPPTIERFMLRDRFSELPEPLREPFPVEIETPDGYSSANVYMLTAEPSTQLVKLDAEADEDLVYVEVPELIIFRILVVEFTKEDAQ